MWNASQEQRTSWYNKKCFMCDHSGTEIRYHHVQRRTPVQTWLLNQSSYIFSWTRSKLSLHLTEKQATIIELFIGSWAKDKIEVKIPDSHLVFWIFAWVWYFGEEIASKCFNESFLCMSPLMIRLLSFLPEH